VLSSAQVAVSNSDIDFKWSISPQLPQPLAAPSAAAGADPAAAAAAAASTSSHYGILLARMAGLPAIITEPALQIAHRLEAKQRQRQMQQEAAGSMQRLRQVGATAATCLLCSWLKYATLKAQATYNGSASSNF
jgi:hypothetical protein